MSGNSDRLYISNLDQGKMNIAKNLRELHGKQNFIAIHSKGRR